MNLLRKTHRTPHFFPMLPTGTISSVSQEHDPSRLQHKMWIAVDNSKYAWHGDDRDARLIHVPHYYFREDSNAACVPWYRPHDDRAEPWGIHALLGVLDELKRQHFVLERTFFTCRDDATRTMGFVDDETFVKH